MDGGGWGLEIVLCYPSIQKHPPLRLTEHTLLLSKDGDIY